MDFLYNLRLLLLILFVCCVNFAAYAVSIISWNLKDFGQSKSKEEIHFIAQVVKDYDIVLIQKLWHCIPEEHRL
jgi:hypothetical protein